MALGAWFQGFSQIQTPRATNDPSRKLGKESWRRKQISDSELHKLMRSPLRGMDTR